MRSNPPASRAAVSSGDFPASVRAMSLSATSSCASRSSARAAAGCSPGEPRDGWPRPAGVDCEHERQAERLRHRLAGGDVGDGRVHAASAAADVVVHGSPSSAHSAPSGSGVPGGSRRRRRRAPAAHTRCSRTAPGGTQRLSIGTCTQLPALHASSVHVKPSSGHESPSSARVHAGRRRCTRRWCRDSGRRSRRRCAGRLP